MRSSRTPAEQPHSAAQRGVAVRVEVFRCGDLDHPVIDGDRQQAAWRQLPVYRRGETVDWASCSRQGSDLGPY